MTTVAAENVAGEPGGWAVSVTTGSREGAVLNVKRIRSLRPYPLSMKQRGDHHGRVFGSSDEAFAFALTHGYLRRYHTAADLRARRVADGAARRKAAEAARCYVIRKREV